MRCLNCNRDGVPTGTDLCPGCGVHLPSLLRDVLPQGTLLHHGKYQVDYALGWGGFGITYIARHVSLNQMVAIKEFYPREHVVRNTNTGHITIRNTQHDSYERAKKRFTREGQMLAMLSHPNVIRVRDLFEENGTAYIAMELISPARTLREVLDAQPSKRLPDSHAREVAAQLVSALDAVHRAGIFHLDIKPENVLLTPAGQAVLIDFGASRQGLGTSSTQAFTLEYAAPEVLAGGEVGPESDLYELGVMLHEMLAGVRPPSALTRLTADEWQPTGVAPQWQGLLASALRLRRGERPSSVRDWWEGRAHATQPQPAPPRPVTPQPPPHRPTPPPSRPVAPTLVVPPPTNPGGRPSTPIAPAFTSPAPRKSRAWLGLLMVFGVISLIVIGVVAAINSNIKRNGTVGPYNYSNYNSYNANANVGYNSYVAANTYNYNSYNYNSYSPYNAYGGGVASTPSAEIESVWVDDDVYDSAGRKGMRIHIRFKAENLSGATCSAAAYFYFDDGRALRDFNNSYKDTGGNVSVGENFFPSSDAAAYSDFKLFMPHDELHLTSRGTYNLKFSVTLWNLDTNESLARSQDRFFTFTRY